jgi:serine/threonine protein kinase
LSNPEWLPQLWDSPALEIAANALIEEPNLGGGPIDDDLGLCGKTVSHYRILEKLGAGGMGVVYRAHDHQLDRDVALKVLPAGTVADETARKQFRKEALLLAKLNHPNIETVFEFGYQDGIHFLAMELIPGRPQRTE